MISRAHMRRQLRANGGITNLRQGYGLGDFVRKLIPNELADIASKTAPFVAPFNPLAAGIMRGVGRYDKRGSLKDALKQGVLTYAGGQGARMLGGAPLQKGFDPRTGSGIKGGKFFSSPLDGEGFLSRRVEELLEGTKKQPSTPSKNRKFRDILKDKELSPMAKVGEVYGGLNPVVKGQLITGGGTFIASLVSEALKDEPEQQPGETMEQYDARRKQKVSSYLRTYLSNTRPTASAEEIDDLVEQYTAEYTPVEEMNKGGRVGLRFGGDPLPEDPTEPINPFRPKPIGPVLPNKRMASDAQNDAILERLYEKYLEMGLDPEDAAKAARREMERMQVAQGGRIGYANAGEVEDFYEGRGTPEERAKKIGGTYTGILPSITGSGADLVDELDYYKYDLGLSKEETINALERQWEESIESGAYDVGSSSIGQLGIKSKEDIRNKIEEGWDMVEAPTTGTGIATVAQGGRIGYAGGGAFLNFIKNMTINKKSPLQFGKDYLKNVKEKTLRANETGKFMDLPLAEVGIPAASGALVNNQIRKKLKAMNEDQKEENLKMFISQLENDEFYDKYPDLKDKMISDYTESLFGEKKADGGRIGYAIGSPEKQLEAGAPPIIYSGNMDPNEQAGLPSIPGPMQMAEDGPEFDMRENGGFQPLGRQEGKDDVPAMLAKNEFVMTADAVRAAGGGSIEKGAQKMYDTMKKLERRVT